MHLLGPHKSALSTYISLGSQLVTFIVLPILMRRNHVRERRSSTVLLVYWPTYLVAFGIWMRTHLATGWFDRHPAELGLTVTVATIGFVLWMLECIGPEHEPGAYHPIGKDINESPFRTANAYSRWTFHWMDGLMKLGSKRPLEEEDVYVLPSEDQAEILTEKLERATEKHSSLWVALAAAYGSTYAEAAVLKVIQDLLAFAQPQFLRLFLAYISLYQASGTIPNSTPGAPSPVKGFVIVAGMFGCAVLQTIVLHQVSDPPTKLTGILI